MMSWTIVGEIWSSPSLDAFALLGLVFGLKHATEVDHGNALDVRSPRSAFRAQCAAALGCGLRFANFCRSVEHRFWIVVCLQCRCHKWSVGSNLVNDHASLPSPQSLDLTSQMKRKTSTLRRNHKCWCRRRTPIKNHKCLCSANGLVQILSRKYSLSLISLIAARERIRFTDIRSEMDDMSTSTLSNRLAEFVRVGLIHRRMFKMTPPRVEYALTNEGERLRQSLLSLEMSYIRHQSKN